MIKKELYTELYELVEEESESKVDRLNNEKTYYENVVELLDEDTSQYAADDLEVFESVVSGKQFDPKLKKAKSRIIDIGDEGSGEIEAALEQKERSQLKYKKETEEFDTSEYDKKIDEVKQQHQNLTQNIENQQQPVNKNDVIDDISVFLDNPRKFRYSRNTYINNYYNISFRII